MKAAGVLVIWLAVGWPFSHCTRTEMDPRSVNFTALPARLMRIWRRRIRSMSNACGKSSAM